MYMEKHTMPTASASSDPNPADDFYCTQILSGLLPVKIEIDSPRVLAFHHTRPSYPVHIVVIPKIHIGSLTHLPTVDPGLVLEMMETVRVVATRVEAEHGCCRVITNLGGYQDSKHLHWHVVFGERIEN